MQVDSMDDDLRNGLWNALTVCCWPDWANETFIPYDCYRFLKMLWMTHFKQRLDELPEQCDTSTISCSLSDHFFNCKWYEVYDFLEFVAQRFPTDACQCDGHFRDECNYILEREMSAYRFVNGEITRITSEEEIESIETATSEKSPSPVRLHLQRALELLSDRQSPDYRNSIKESISAVESLAAKIVGEPKATLGQALKKLDDKVDLHSALKEAFSKLYGYTSDANGIRHSMLDEPNLSFEDAKYMLVSCSAFVNYLTTKAANAGLEI